MICDYLLSSSQHLPNCFSVLPKWDYSGGVSSKRGTGHGTKSVAGSPW